MNSRHKSCSFSTLGTVWPDKDNNINQPDQGTLWGCQASQQSICGRSFFHQAPASGSKSVDLVYAIGSGTPAKDGHLLLTGLPAPDGVNVVTVG